MRKWYVQRCVNNTQVPKLFYCSVVRCYHLTKFQGMVLCQVVTCLTGPEGLSKGAFRAFDATEREYERRIILLVT